MALTAGNIIARATDALFDPTGVRWDPTVLLGHLNDGQRAICSIRPDACSTTENVQLAAGVKQELPVEAIRLLDVVRNMGGGGATPGASIVAADMDKVKRYNPGWATATASDTIKAFMYDPRTPTVFYVFPPLSGSTYVECKLAKLPTDCASTSSPLSIHDGYANPLLSYVLFRALWKDIETPLTGQARAFYELFMQELGAKTSTDVAILPDGSFAPIGGNPAKE